MAAVAALPLCLLLASRGRWVAAGAVLGAAAAHRPLLAPVALLFLFAGRWRALGVLLLVHTVLVLPHPAYPFLPDPFPPDPAYSFPPDLAVGLPGVPSWLSGGAWWFPDPLAPSGPPDPSGPPGPFPPSHAAVSSGPLRAPATGPGEAVRAAGGPPWRDGSAVRALALLVAAAGVVRAHRRWRGPGPALPRLAETATGLVLSAFLVLRPSWTDHLLVVVPLLLTGLPSARSAALRPWFWLALVPQLPGVAPPGPGSGRRRASGRAAVWCAARAGRRGARGRAAGAATPVGAAYRGRIGAGRRCRGRSADGTGPVLTRPAAGG
ncbi:hypothetical protein [Streptomyces sp. enrichment culture]|uniref:hypothetical protein n=1 Tax=Streptomyces sp. enrichment culture TaxID=1795815 RepID=UPI003F56E4E1